ncbi:MAG: hypothetical protein IBX63_09895 [Coriobacteriia bacterium]|nr:hypothetical protein [Coriobacteriia bacterium]
MKRCGVCDKEYADDYDACPECAKLAAVKPDWTGVWVVLGVLVLAFGADVPASAWLLFSAVLGIGVGLDAKKLGIRKGLTHWWLDNDPLLWGILVFAIWGIAFPVYMWHRPRLKLLAAAAGPKPRRSRSASPLLIAAHEPAPPPAPSVEIDESDDPFSEANADGSGQR